MHGTPSTVLVLGAGASRPYGFPLGQELKEGICGMIGNWLEGTRQSPDLAELISKHGFTRDIQETFFRALSTSPRNSIDAFLEIRTEFRDLGKTWIAAIIAHTESASPLTGQGLAKIE